MTGRGRLPHLAVLAACSLLLLSAPSARAVSPDAGKGGACARLFVPEAYGLRCEEGPDGSAVVSARSGQWAALERLVLRELQPLGPDRLAWVAPHRWLRRRAEADFHGLADLLVLFARSELGEDRSQALDAELEWLRRRLAELAAGFVDRCRARSRAGVETLDCRIGVAPFRLFYQLRLIAAGERRFSVEITALDRRRLRHFEAVANSLRPLS